jgi:hypothetical protein
MAIKPTDLILVHRGGTDYSAQVSELPHPDSAGFPEAPDDGNLYGRDGQVKGWVQCLPYDISQLPPLTV